MTLAEFTKAVSRLDQAVRNLASHTCKVDLVEFSRFANSYKPGHLQERVLFPDASGPAVGV
jgi:hypothetical protein